MKLIMMRGLPASGKSTKAEEIIKGGASSSRNSQGEFFRVNRDLLRKMLHCDVFTGKREGATIHAQQLLVAHLLQEGKNVIVDDTNLGEKHVNMWKMMADMYSAKFEIIDMMDNVSLTMCLARNEARGFTVPQHVIEQMAMQYKHIPYSRLVVCDIDGTIADCSHRQHHVQKDGPKDWKSFFAGMKDDEPRHDVYKKALKLAKYESGKHTALVLVSARPEDYREVTEQWLRDNGMEGHFTILMRRKGDKRPDTDVKGDIYERYLKHYDIVKVFDDRPSVIRMWQEHGLEVEDCGNGEEF